MHILTGYLPSTPYAHQFNSNYISFWSSITQFIHRNIVTLQSKDYTKSLTL